MLPVLAEQRAYAGEIGAPQCLRHRLRHILDRTQCAGDGAIAPLVGVHHARDRLP